MAHYNQGQRKSIATINLGIQVETGDLAATTYMATDDVAALFAVKGRIRIMQLFGEVTTNLGGGAPVVRFRAAWTDPVIAAADMSANSGDISGLQVGARITLVGTTVATATAITASRGVSYGTLAPQTVGLDGGTGWIGVVTSTNDVEAGEINWVINYLPLSTGAVVTSDPRLIT